MWEVIDWATLKLKEVEEKNDANQNLDVGYDSAEANFTSGQFNVLKELIEKFNQ